MLKIGSRVLLIASVLTIQNIQADECDGWAPIISRYYNKCQEFIDWGFSINIDFGIVPTLIPDSIEGYSYLQCYSTNNIYGLSINYHSNRFPTVCAPTDDSNTPFTPSTTLLATQNSNSCSRSGSIIQTSNQVVGEIIPLVGVPFYLTHFSNRVSGKLGEYKTVIVLSGSQISSKITGFNLMIKDEQNNLISSNSLSAIANQVSYYQWDGIENGIVTWGAVKRNITIKTSSNSAAIADSSFTLLVGSLKAKKLGLGGWVPSIWHFYDSVAEKVYSGDGSVRNVKAVQDGIFNRVASVDGSEVYYFDSIGRLSFTKTGLTGALIYSFNYDQVTQKLLSITDAFNKVTKFKYDNAGNLYQIISAENIKTNFSVDQNGYLKTVTNPKNEIYSMVYQDAGGLLSSFTKPNGVKTLFTYDENGNLLTDVNSGGHSSTLIKTDQGINAVSTLGRVTQNNYNAETLTETQVNPSGLSINYVSATNESSVIAPHFSSKTFFQEDLRFGNQVKVPLRIESQNFGESTTSFSQEVNLADPSNPFSVSSMSKTISDGQSEIVSTYDSLTRTNTLTTSMGRSFAIQIDSLERPIWEKVGTLVPRKFTYENDLLTKVKQGEREYRYIYHPQSKLLTSIVNPNGEIESFEYDEAQRLKTKIFPDGRKVKFIYDSEGNLVSLTPAGRPEHKQIIGSNELISSYNPPGLVDVANVNTTYAYNQDRQLTKITKPNGAIINYNYNSTTGLLDSVSGGFGTISANYQNELPVKYQDSTGRAVEFNYVGNVISIETAKTNTGKIISTYSRGPSGEGEGLLSFESIEAGNSKRVIDYEYDGDKVLIRKGEFNLNYSSPNGSLTQTSIGNIKEYYRYDKFGEIEEYKASIKKGKKEQLLYSFSLNRDRSGRIVEKVETFEKDCTKKNENNRGRNIKQHCQKFDRDIIEAKYSYDKSGRLIRTRNNNVSDTNYLYDLNSNRISGNIRREGFFAIYDNQDRLIRFNNNVYTYNANGELLTKAVKVKNGYQTTDYVYDVFGQLRKAGNVTYNTNLQNRRSAKLVNGLVQRYYTYTPEGQLIGELDANMNLVKTFVYASKSHVPDYFIDQNGNSFKIITDHLGSVRLVVDVTTGEVVQKMQHDEFGIVLVDTKPNATPFGFAGGLYDVETGFVRFGARDYDPQIGRWTSKDPIRFEGGDSNLYGYVLTDPVNYIDPEGKWSVPIAEVLIGIIRGTFGVTNGNIVCGKIGGGNLNEGEDEALADYKKQKELERLFKEKGYISIPKPPLASGPIYINPNPIKVPSFIQGK